MVSRALGLQVHAIVLHLSNFAGSLNVEGNTFEDNSFKFSDCGVFEQWSNTYSEGENEYATLDSYHTPDVFQQKSLIFLKGFTSPISIAGNTFARNTATHGLIQIHMHNGDASDQPYMLLHGNTFS